MDEKWEDYYMGTNGEKRVFYTKRERELYYNMCDKQILNKLNNDLIESIKNKSESSSITLLSQMFLEDISKEEFEVFKVKVIKNNAIAIFMKSYEKMGDWGFLYNVYAVTYYIKHGKF